MSSFTYILAFSLCKIPIFQIDKHILYSIVILIYAFLLPFFLSQVRKYQDYFNSPALGNVHVGEATEQEGNGRVVLRDHLALRDHHMGNSYLKVSEHWILEGLWKILLLKRGPRLA